MRDFRELLVWRKAHELTLACYKATDQFPAREIYSLGNQMGRSSASVPTNIAEGCGHFANAEFHRYLQIAMASSSEVDYQLLFPHDLGYLKNDEHSKLSAQTLEMKRMLVALAKKVAGN
jgi:four helix bundle protein